MTANEYWKVMAGRIEGCGISDATTTEIEQCTRELQARLCCADGELPAGRLADLAQSVAQQIVSEWFLTN